MADCWTELLVQNAQHLAGPRRNPPFRHFIQCFQVLGGLCRFLAWLMVTFFVIIFWQPITALFKFYRDGVYETSTGNQRVDARIRKRQSDLTASRGELIEVNVESAFEPIIQGYIIFPNIIDIADKMGKMVTITDGGNVQIALQFTTVETAQLLSIITSMVSLAWCYSEYHSVRKNMLLDMTVSPCSRVTMFLYMLMQVKENQFPFHQSVFHPPSLSLTITPVLSKNSLFSDNCSPSRFPVVCPLLGPRSPISSHDLRCHPHASLFNPSCFLLRRPLLPSEGEVSEVRPQHTDERFCYHLLSQLPSDG